MVDTFSKHALELADLLLQKGKEGKEVDTQDLFSRATLDSIGVVYYLLLYCFQFFNLLTTYFSSTSSSSPILTCFSSSPYSLLPCLLIPSLVSSFLSLFPPCSCSCSFSSCSSCYSSSAFRLPSLFFFSSLKSKIAFGENIDSLHKEAPFANAFNQAQLSIDDRAFFPFWKYMPWLASERRLRHSMEILNSFAYGLIANRKKDSEVAEKRDLLSRYY
jgi:hypothetical protein